MLGTPMNRRRTGASILALALAVMATEGRAGVAQSHSVRVVFETGFEPGEPMPTAPKHQVAAGRAHSGNRSLSGEVTDSNQACIFNVPFQASAKSLLHVTLWARSEKVSRCAVFVRTPAGRKGLARVDTSARWTLVEASYQVDRDTRGTIEIVGPSSFGVRPGKMWIDDVRIVEVAGECEWPRHVEDFPALTTDGQGRVWMAQLERPVPRRFVRVYRIDEGKPIEVCTLEPPGLTGIAPPAIAGCDDGCIVAFPVERKDRWRIAYAFIDGSGPRALTGRTIECGGSSNISPAIAVVDDRACVVWESNADGDRSIQASWIRSQGEADLPVRISAANANSYNPSVVALADGSLVAAWDSVHEGEANIYVAAFREGRWSDDRAITSDPRIERHPHLAACGNEVWMAWQAQSYRDNRLNAVNEQRVAVAQIVGKRMMAPKGAAESVVAHDGLLMRPQIAFDPAGRLWLTARESVGRQAGWRALAWCFGGGGYGGPWRLQYTSGRWRPVPMAFGVNGAIAAVQFDDLPDGWNDQGKRPDWKSGVALRALPIDAAPAGGLPETELFEIPSSEFSLPEAVERVSADLPRQSVERGGEKLTLYFGDLHDHTDLSVCARATNPPGHDLFANVRDIERLDFCALTDHGYNLDAPQWQFNGEQTRANHDAGRFVTFLGQEWTSDHVPYDPPRQGRELKSKKVVELRRYGHRNLIFRNEYHGEFYDSRDGNIPPEQVWEKFAPGEIISIPHQLADLGNRPTDWTHHDERYQPVAEIFQTRGSYEYLGAPRNPARAMDEPGYYLQDAWAQGITIGTIASPDHGGGDGKVGVWAPRLTRHAIYDAIRARHTFGTSGPKMGLFVTCGDAMMGDKVERPDGALRFDIRAVAKREIKELVIFRNNEIVHHVQPNKTNLDESWTDPNPPRTDRLWYYVRIHAIDDEIAWSSPIWFLQSTK